MAISFTYVALPLSHCTASVEHLSNMFIGILSGCKKHNKTNSKNRNTIFPSESIEVHDPRVCWS